jgi:hypothetical protein
MTKTFLVYESGAMSGRRELARFGDFDAAETFVKALPLVAYNRDEDYPGCADAFTKDGMVVCIAVLS